MSTKKNKGKIASESSSENESDSMEDLTTSTEESAGDIKDKLRRAGDSPESPEDSDSSESSDEITEIQNSRALQMRHRKNPVKNSNEIFKELIKRQLSETPPQWKLNINDMKRICKYINTSIFDPNQCCIWNGYITNINNTNKGTYVNFYFRNKKVALHRLLYSNFVAPLDSSEYLKFNCENKGICCNINHYEKYKYSKNNSIAKKYPRTREPKKQPRNVIITGSDDPDKLIIDFD